MYNSFKNHVTEEHCMKSIKSIAFVKGFYATHCFEFSQVKSLGWKQCPPCQDVFEALSQRTKKKRLVWQQETGWRSWHVSRQQRCLKSSGHLFHRQDVFVTLVLLQSKRETKRPQNSCTEYSCKPQNSCTEYLVEYSKYESNHHSVQLPRQFSGIANKKFFVYIYNIKVYDNPKAVIKHFVEVSQIGMMNNSKFKPF